MRGLMTGEVAIKWAMTPDRVRKLLRRAPGPIDGVHTVGRITVFDETKLDGIRAALLAATKAKAPTA